jgi:hypothetical protein
MDQDANSCRSRDFLSRPWLAFLLYGLPVIAILVSGSAHISELWRTLVWTLALLVMGAACAANARRCGRVHCYLTGPFFLLLAAVTMLYGFGILRLGHNGWNMIGLALLIGAVVLCCLPEMLFGKYRHAHPTGARQL